jgi:hypothetical protein
MFYSETGRTYKEFWNKMQVIELIYPYISGISASQSVWRPMKKRVSCSCAAGLAVFQRGPDRAVGGLEKIAVYYVKQAELAGFRFVRTEKDRQIFYMELRKI